MCQDSVDHCRVKMNFHNGQYTSGDVKWDVNGDHCDMSQDTQWSTAKNMVVPWNDHHTHHSEL